jgi:hypothetical protein
LTVRSWPVSRECFFGINLGSNSQLRVGYWADRRRVEVDTGTSLLPTGKKTDAGLTASGFFDNRDASTFASRGTAAEIQYFRSDDGLGADRHWERLEAAARHVMRAGATTLWLTAAGGTDLGSARPPTGTRDALVCITLESPLE